MSANPQDEQPSQTDREVWEGIVTFGPQGADEAGYDREFTVIQVYDRYVRSLESFVRTFYSLGRAHNLADLKQMVERNYPSIAREAKREEGS